MEYPKVGVGVIIEKNNKVLLQRRKNVLGDCYWSTPGGHLDFGETPDECAIREVEEETSLIIKNVWFRRRRACKPFCEIRRGFSASMRC